MQHQAFRAYLENRILNASAEQLQLMLYEGAMRFTHVARAALVDKNLEKAQDAFERVDRILSELHCGLRPEADADLCEKFAALYNFVQRKLLEANFTHSTAPLDEALTILGHLRETWVIVLERMAQERADAAARHEGLSLAGQL